MKTTEYYEKLNDVVNTSYTVPATYPRHKLKNLARLALMLDKLHVEPDKFKMDNYFYDNFGSCSSPRYAAKDIKHCGTSACVIGWAKIKKIGTSSKNDTWLDFLIRNFTEHGFWHDYSETQFMFGPKNVNCPQAAARRIAFFLQYRSYVTDPNHIRFINKEFMPNWEFIKSLKK